MKEVWKDIPNQPGYQISTLGRVKSLKWGGEKILKLNATNKYLNVCLSNKGKIRVVMVQILMAETFLGKKIYDRTCVKYLDDNHKNNCLDNLKVISKYKDRQTYKMKHYKSRQYRVIRFKINIPEHVYSSYNDIVKDLGHSRLYIKKCIKNSITDKNGFFWMEISLKK
jgi:hypothetical protein